MCSIGVSWGCGVRWRCNIGVSWGCSIGFAVYVTLGLAGGVAGCCMGSA